MANKLSLAFDIIARDNDASKTFQNVGDSAEKAGKKGEGFGSSLKKGLGIAAGAIAAAGLGQAFTGFIQGAQESARIGRLTDAVLKSTGGTANITAEQVGNLATAISNKTALDDEMIQSSANVLLTFTKVRNEVGKGNDIFNRATESAANMSVALGTDMQSATTMLGKALNDPIAGITAMTRAGVQFTDQQKEQIRAMVGAGDTLGAQRIILAEMETQFGGAAAAAADPIERLKVVAGNLGETVGGLLLPHIEKFATFISDTVAPALEGFFSGMQTGSGPGGALASFGSFLGDEVIPRLQAFAGFIGDEVIPRLQDFAGWVQAEVVPRLKEFAEYVATNVVPRIQDIGRWFREDALPVLVKVGKFLADTFRPTFLALADLWQKHVLPRIAELREAFEKYRPQLEMVAKAVGTIIGVFGALVAKIAGFVLPILVKVGGFIVDVLVGQIIGFIETIGKGVDVIQSLGERFGEAWNKARDFIDNLKDVKLPPWIQTIADLVGTVASGMGTAASKVGSFFGDLFGDGPGRQGGGNTLNRVRSLLPAGAYITSTYRTPAQNRAVGGVTGSYHTDQNNPAVDIAGTRQAMDAVYARLAAVGGWRELLYKVKGHWDHVHVAHTGGVVSPSWPSMPGWRSDERPARLQVGETVVPKGAAVGGVTVNVTADPGLAYEYAQHVADQSAKRFQDVLAVHGLTGVGVLG